MLRLAWRNLWRNRTRTLIVVAAVSLSYALMLLSMGLGDASHAKMEQAAVRTAGGNLLIHGDGYWLDQASDQLVTDPLGVMAAVSDLPGVEAVIPRVIINGLVSSPHGSVGVRLTGIDPVAEAQLADVGRFLVEGSALDGQVDPPLLLGAGIVDELQLELGDRVVLTATAPDGEVVRALFHLTGVLRSGSDAFDDFMAYTTIPAARGAVGLGSELTQVGVLIADDAHRRQVRDALAARLGDASDTLELLTWDDAIPEMVGLIEIDDAFGYLYMAIVFVVVGFGIANTFLMSVLERVRELGLLSAIGLSPARTLRLVFSEALWLAFLSLALGFALGFAGHLYFRDVGLDLRDIYGFDIELAGVTLDDLYLRSELNPGKWLTASLSVLGLVLVTSLYPAWRAVRLDPAQAMRTYE